jgi:hypothetical protein
MWRLRRLTQLTVAEGRVLIRALLVVGVARASLWILPIKAVRKVVARAATGAAGDSVDQLVWAVRVVSRYLPDATCLPQALSAQALLTHSGFPSQVEMGVAKDELHRFHAHAWVVCQGQVVLGGQDVERYNSLVVWDRAE